MSKLKFFALSLASILLICSCSTTPKEASTSASNHAVAVTDDNAPDSDASNHAVAVTDDNAPDSDASNVQHDTADDIFKYTITTDIDTKGRHNIEILIAVNSVNDQYFVEYELDCEGDGEFEYKALKGSKKCIYKKNSGKHQIWLRGDIPAIFLCKRPDDDRDDLAKLDMPQAVVSIDNWGNIPWKSMAGFAAGCYALNKMPKNSPDLRQVTDMSRMFLNATSFNQPIEKWNVSNVTDMSMMFTGATAFNQPLEAWKVSNVKNMSGMFWGADAFNQPLEKWNVSSVTDMHDMFQGADVFNQPLDAWNVENVKNMRGMFGAAESFNQPIEKWNVTNVTNMESMFWAASSFNQPLEKWNVTNVESMAFMFGNAKSFNQPLDAWNIANVKRMNGMFGHAKAFSHYPKNWVVPASDLVSMFEGSNVEAEADRSPLKTK